MLTIIIVFPLENNRIPFLRTRADQVKYKIAFFQSVRAQLSTFYDGRRARENPKP